MQKTNLKNLGSTFQPGSCENRDLPGANLVPKLSLFRGGEGWVDERQPENEVGWCFTCIVVFVRYLLSTRRGGDMIPLNISHLSIPG